MTTTLDTATATARHATWTNLGLTYVGGVALLAIQSIAYHHWSHGENSLGSDIPFYAVSGVVGVALGALALARVRRSRRPGTAGRVATALAVVALVIFPVGYYMPVTAICGATAFLLSQDAGPGRLAATARVLAAVAVLCQAAVVVARLVGVTYQVGG